LFIDTAYAMGQAGGGAASGSGGGFTAFIPLILMFVVFYFLLIRPQQKKAKEHKSMIAGLRVGDKIITGGGIYGEIMAIDESFATVEISKEVNIKINRGSIAALIGGNDSALPHKDKKKKE